MLYHIFPGFCLWLAFSQKVSFLSAGYLPILEHLVNTRLNYSERSRVSSAVDSTWELNERLWEKAGEACWPVTLRLDQVCVRRETVMVKLLSQKIIIAEALLAAGGRSVKDRKQKTMHRRSRWTENALCEFDLLSVIMSAEQPPQICLLQMIMCCFDIWFYKEVLLNNPTNSSENKYKKIITFCNEYILSCWAY